MYKRTLARTHLPIQTKLNRKRKKKDITKRTMAIKATALTMHNTKCVYVAYDSGVMNKSRYSVL